MTFGVGPARHTHTAMRQICYVYITLVRSTKYVTMAQGERERVRGREGGREKEKSKKRAGTTSMHRIRGARAPLLPWIFMYTAPSIIVLPPSPPPYEITRTYTIFISYNNTPYININE